MSSATKPNTNTEPAASQHGKLPDADTPPPGEAVNAQIDDLRGDLSRLGQDVKGLYNALLDAGKSSAEDAQGQLSDTKDTVDKFIREKPVQSLAIAIGAGWVISKLLK